MNHKMIHFIFSLVSDSFLNIRVTQSLWPCYTRCAIQPQENIPNAWLSLPMNHESILLYFYSPLVQMNFNIETAYSLCPYNTRCATSPQRIILNVIPGLSINHKAIHFIPSPSSFIFIFI